MNTVRTVFLPPAKPRPELFYDRHQFRKAKKTVTRDNGVSFQDVKGMSVISKARATIQSPPWSTSDKKIQLVAVRMLWAMVHMTTLSFPQAEFDKDPLSLAIKLEEQLRKRCVNFAVQRNRIQRDVILGQKKNKKFGYARLLIRIMYETYRLKKKSNEIAAELHGLVSPAGVRQTLMRANKIARVIFPPEENAPFDKRTGDATKQDIGYKRAQFSSGETKVRHGRREGLPSNKELFQLTQSGRTVEDLATEYEIYPTTMKRKIRNGQREFFGKKSTWTRLNSPDIILQMYKEGCSIEKIARLAEVPLAYVHCILTTKYGKDLNAAPPR